MNAMKRDQYVKRFVSDWKKEHDDEEPSHAQFMEAIFKRCNEVDPSGREKSLLGLAFHHVQLGPEVHDPVKRYRKPKEVKNNDYFHAKSILLMHDVWHFYDITSQRSSQRSSQRR